MTILDGQASGTAVVTAVDGSVIDSSQTVTLTASATSYTPAPDFHGSDSFTLRWDDQQGSTGVVIVPVWITPINDPPIANSATLTTLEDTQLIIDLSTLANDPDDTLSFSAGPIFTLTPPLNQSGPQQFSYTVSDGTDSAAATITINIIPVDDPPLAVADSATTDEDSPIALDLLANDSDVDSPLSLQSWDSPNFDGSTYTPPANFHGVETFTYTLSTGQTANVTITVNPIDDPPINAAPPTIIGSLLPGHSVQADPGSWTDVDSPLNFAYQWQLDQADIPGATDSSYAIVSDDLGHTLSVTVTVTTIAKTSAARQVGWQVTLSGAARGDIVTFGMSDGDGNVLADSGPSSLLVDNLNFDTVWQPFADSASWILHTNSDSDLALHCAATELPAARYLSCYEIIGPDDRRPSGAPSTRIADNGALLIPGGERWHLIRFDSVLREIFVFRRGWNLFSFPFQPQNAAPMALWSLQSDQMVRAEMPEAFRGYWTWQPQRRVYRFDGTPAALMIQVGPGVSSIGVDRWFAPSWNLLSPPLYWSRRGFRETHILQPRHGYLIHSAEAKTLTW